MSKKRNKWERELLTKRLNPDPGTHTDSKLPLSTRIGRVIIIIIAILIVLGSLIQLVQCTGRVMKAIMHENEYDD